MNFKFKYLKQIVTSFLFITILFFCIIIVLIGTSQHWFEKRISYYTYLDNGLDISAGLDVKLAGYDIGYVKSVKLVSKSDTITVKVIFVIYEGYQHFLTEDSTLALYKPILGKPFFKILPGTSSEILPPGYLIRLSQKNIFNDKVNRVISKIEDKLIPAIDNINQVSDQSVRIAQTLNNVLRKMDIVLARVNKGDSIISKLLQDKESALQFDSLLSDSTKIMKDLKAVSDEFRIAAKTFPKYTSQLEQLLGNTNQLMKGVKNLMSPERIKNYNEMTNQINTMSQNINKFSKNLAEITDKINSGQGTIGKVITDDTLHNQMEDILKESKTTVTDAKKIVAKLSDIKTYMGLDVQRNFSQNFFKNKIFLKIEPTHKNFYKLGVNVKTGIDIPNNGSINFRDAPLTRDDYDEIKVNFDLQLGYKLKQYPLTVYGGLIESNLGGGMTYDINDRLSANIMSRGVSDEENFDTRVNTSFDIGYRAWKQLRFYGGVNNLFGETEYTAGFRLY